MKVVVVGAAGFIGKRVSSYLREKGHEIVAFDNRMADGVRVRDWAAGSSDGECKGANALIHLAAWPYEGWSFRNPARTYREGLITLARSCEVAARLEIPRIVYTSSISIYGNGQGWKPPWNESVPPMPRSPYGHSKLAGEHLLRCMALRYGFMPIVLRLGQIYGPGMKLGDRGRAVISIFMSALLKGEPMPVVGEGKQRRSFLFVDDLCPVFEKCCRVREWSLGSVNVASGEPISIQKLAELVASTGGYPPSLGRRDGGIAHDAFLDSYLARTSLSFEARSLEEGLAETWEWAKGQPIPRWQAEYPKLERNPA